jgi:hypothetical protein
MTIPVSILTEFETIVATRLNCLSNDENIESLKAAEDKIFSELCMNTNYKTESKAYWLGEPPILTLSAF